MTLVFILGVGGLALLVLVSIIAEISAPQPVPSNTTPNKEKPTMETNPYQQPYRPYVAPPALPKVDGLAIASLVLGICWVYWIGSILAVVFGAVALKRIAQSQGWRTGRGMAIAGLTLGFVGCGTLVLFIIAALSASGN